jgi:endonuclease/exonuclease/phosphatase family metal-dependent hydrolase
MRIATLNLWGAHVPLERRLLAAARGLAPLGLDCLLVQEVRAGDVANTAEQLAALLGGPWRAAYACAVRGGAGAFGPGSGPGEEGLAILAPGPIDDVRALALPASRPGTERILLSARVGPIWAHTTHLNWRLGDGVEREAQVVAASDAARACGDGVHVLGGDLNAAPDCDEIRYLVGKHTLAGRRALWQDAFARTRPDDAGVTFARRNPMTEELTHLERDRRIDYLLVSPEQRDGRARVLDARVILDAPDADGVWPSDHFGVLAELRV